MKLAEEKYKQWLALRTAECLTQGKPPATLEEAYKEGWRQCTYRAEDVCLEALNAVFSGAGKS